MSAVEIVNILVKMSMPAKAINPSEIEAEISCTRSGKQKTTTTNKIIIPQNPHFHTDILHACDIAEDVGIAFGYNNLKAEIPRTFTVAAQNPLNKITDAIRVTNYFFS
jgi:phenylalanyl-tRNA synthetase beta subunit